MDIAERIETGLHMALHHSTSGSCPAKLAGAFRHAVFPGGARIRPRLCLAVALACGDRHARAATAAAVAIELLHCASLVHDDMPCFDDAAVRRDKPTVHVAFGEEIALLTGDGLIVAAFETLARETMLTPALTAPLVATIATAVGSPHGLVAGQAWESEPDMHLGSYHQAKTASLFVGAVSAGAIAASGNPRDWTALAKALGAAYQVADDLYDAVGETGSMGKPAGQDLRNGKPNIVAELGVEDTLRHLRKLVETAADNVPDCPGAESMKAMIRKEATRLMPAKLPASAA